MRINVYASLILLLISFGGTDVFGQTNYTSVGTGAWTDAATWSPQIAGGPDYTAGTITINANHTVTIPSSATIQADQLTVQADGKLLIEQNASLIVNNDLGTTIDLNLLVGSGKSSAIGVIENAGSLIVSSGAQISNSKSTQLLFKPTAVCQYEQLDGTINQATWDVGSSLLINGIFGTSVSGLNQTFSNFYWNCSNQSGYITFEGEPSRITGDFVIQNTGSGEISLTDNIVSTLTIDRDFIIGDNARLYFNYFAAIDVNVGRDLISTTNHFIELADEANVTLNVERNLEINSANGTGIFNLAGLTGTGNSTINIKGNLSHTSGTLTDDKVKVGQGTLNFIGSNSQVYTGGGTWGNAIDIVIQSGSVLDLTTGSIAGNNTFTLQTGATLKTAHPDGIASTTTSGAIKVPSLNRTYEPSSKFVYNGSGAQSLGAGYPGTQDVSLEIANEVSVAMSDDLTIGNTDSLTLTKGALIIGSNLLNLNGSVTIGTGTITGSSTSNLTIGGTGALGTIPFSTTNNTLNNFTLARGTSGSVTLGGDLTVLGTIAFTDGTLNLNGNSLTIKGGLTQTAGTIASSSTSSLVIQGTGALGNLPFATGSTLGTLVMDRTSTGSAGLASNLTIAQLLNLSNGAFENGTYLTMGTDATIRRAAGGSLSAAPMAASAYRVEYTSGLTTGNELPASPALSDLIVNASGTVILNKDISVNDTLRLTNGTLDLSTRTAEVKNKLIINAPLQASSSSLVFNGSAVEISGTVAPAYNEVRIATGASVLNTFSSFSVAGNWENNGAFDAGSSTVTFNGTTGFSGTTAPSFHHVAIAGALTAPSGNMNVSGDWTYSSGSFTSNSGTITFDGAAQSITNGAQPFHNLVASGSGTKTLQDALDVDGSLSINAGAGLSVGSNQPINLAGNLVNDGNFTGGTGTVYFDGISGQSVGGTATTAFHNMQILNKTATGVVLNGPVNLEKTLQLAASTAFNSNGNLTLLSTSDNGTSDARIAGIPSTATFTGAVTIQRYMSGEGRYYRYLTAPVQGAIVADWQDDFKIIGNFTGASNGITSSTSMYWYDETVAGTSNQGYKPYPPAGSSNQEPLTVGRGFTPFIDEGNGPVIVDVSGEIIQGDYTYNLSNNNLSFTSSEGGIDGDGWNLIGNVYPSQIDFSLLDAAADFNNVDYAFYIRDAADNGTVRSWVNGTGTNLPQNYSLISSGQAFWVKANGANPSLTFHESIKNTGSASYYRKAAPTNYMRITLVQGEKRDENVIRVHSEATAEHDSRFDAYKMKNGGIFNLSTLTPDSSELAINTQALEGCELRFPMVVSEVTPGTYAFELSEWESMDNTLQLYLIDHLTGSSINIKETQQYEFAVTSEENSYQNRFEVRISRSALALDLAVSGSTECFGEGTLLSLASSQDGVSYQPYLNGVALGSVQQGTGAAMDFSIAAEHLTAGTHTFQVQASWDGCEPLMLNESHTFTVEPVSEITETTGGSRCGEGTLELQASGAPEGGTYRWYATAEDTTPLAETSTGAFTTPEIMESTYFYVSAVNTQGCENSQRTAVLAEVSQLATLVVTETTGAAGCGPQALQLQASGAPEGGSYRWYTAVDAGSSIEGATSATFTTPALSEPTTYYVSVVNANGCEGSERTAVLADIQTIYPVSAVEGASSCGAASLTLSASGAPAEGSYRWYTSPDANTPIEGVSTASFSTPELSATTSYYVSTLSPSGCESEKVEVVATINQLERPLITENGGVLYSNQEEGNQWFLNEVAIEGATEASYVPTENGSYSVETTVGNCSAFSDAIAFEPLGVRKDLAEAGIRFSPNPARESIHLQWAKPESSKVTVEIVSLNGTKVGSYIVQTKDGIVNTTLPIAHLPNGMYILQISTKNLTFQTRFVKL